MLKRLPVIPTLLVLAAVAVMVRLGFWQLERADQKEELLARYKSAQIMSADVPWPVDKQAAEAVLFRHTRITCLKTGTDSPMSGHNAQGQSGWAHVVTCTLAGGGQAEVVLGWSRDPALRTWPGGEVAGMIAEGINAPARLFADQPLAGLELSARPDPADIPNNHLSYMVQWFLFALTALVIYGLALRKRLKGA